MHFYIYIFCQCILQKNVIVHFWGTITLKSQLGPSNQVSPGVSLKSCKHPETRKKMMLLKPRHGHGTFKGQQMTNRLR